MYLYKQLASTFYPSSSFLPAAMTVITLQKVNCCFNLGYVTPCSVSVHREPTGYLHSNIN